MRSRLLRAGLVAVMAAGVGAFTAPAHADSTCTDAGCVSTTGDPTTGHFGVGISGSGVNVCVVVFATCPEPPTT